MSRDTPTTSRDAPPPGLPDPAGAAQRVDAAPAHGSAPARGGTPDLGNAAAGCNGAPAHGSALARGGTPDLGNATAGCNGAPAHGSAPARGGTPDLGNAAAGCNGAPAPPSEALQHFRRSLASALAAGDPTGEAESLNGLGEALREQEYAAEAAAAHRAALSVAAAARIRSEQVSAHVGLANALHDAGDVEDARRHWTKALRLHADPAGAQAAEIRARLTQTRTADETSIPRASMNPAEPRPTGLTVTPRAGRRAAAPRA